jgi:hypothetical protein
MKRAIEPLEMVIQKRINFINGLVTRKGGRGLHGLLLGASRVIYSKSSPSVARQVLLFAGYCFKIGRHMGLKGLVIKLKASQVLLQQSVGGNVVLDITELKMRVRRTKKGIPRIIPGPVRRRILLDRDLRAIRLWMTLFGLFRILEFPGRLSLNTITDPGRDLSHFLPKWETWLREEFLPNLYREIRIMPKLGKLTMFPILKASPTTGKARGISEAGSIETTSIFQEPIVNSSPYSMVRGARLLTRIPGMETKMSILASCFDAVAFWNRIQLVSMAGTNSILDQPIWREALWPVDKGWLERTRVLRLTPRGYLGKLGFKIEPAGKIRSFAMVDAWTQWLMAPLHSWIFKHLRLLKTDGTFNQMSPIILLQNNQAKYHKKLVASIDLSAATDRLPISIQMKILEVLLEPVVPDSKLFAEAWRDLLVDRQYEVRLTPELRKNLEKAKMSPAEIGSIPKSVIYSVGQPMGALSSWGMLALTHHAMIQYSAYLAGHRGKWFKDYAVLGDDSSIIGGTVVRHYRDLLNTLGVKAGLAKSIMARGSFVIEFAKKFFVDNGTANMVPFKELIAARISTQLIVELSRKYNVPINGILSFLGYGYRAKSKFSQSNLWSLGGRMRTLMVVLTTPKSPLGRPTYVSWLFAKSLYTDLSPSVEALVSVVKLLDLCCDQLEATALKTFQRYIKSYDNVAEQYDRDLEVAITRETTKLGAEHAQSFKQKISWLRILNNDFSEKSIVDISGENVTYVDPGTLVMRQKPVIKYDDKLHSDFLIEAQKARLPQLSTILRGAAFSYVKRVDPSKSQLVDIENQLRFKIERMLQFYFADHRIFAVIPKEFWVTFREDPKAFTNFLVLFKFWKDLSRPAWQEYYKTQREDKSKDLEQQKVGKVKLSKLLGMVAVGGVITKIEVPLSRIKEYCTLRTIFLDPPGGYPGLRRDFFSSFQYPIHNWMLLGLFTPWKPRVLLILKVWNLRILNIIKALLSIMIHSILVVVLVMGAAMLVPDTSPEEGIAPTHLVRPYAVGAEVGEVDSNIFFWWLIGSVTLIILFAMSVKLSRYVSNMEAENTSLSIKVNDLSIERDTLSSTVDALQLTLNDQVITSNNLIGVSRELWERVHSLTESIQSLKESLKQGSQDMEVASSTIENLNRTLVENLEMIADLQSANQAWVNAAASSGHSLGPAIRSITADGSLVCPNDYYRERLVELYSHVSENWHCDGELGLNQFVTPEVASQVISIIESIVRNPPSPL